jgi:type II secretory pathway pseudopilin PulG
VIKEKKMKPIIKQSNTPAVLLRKNEAAGAFTIVELLTVMSIIVILIGLLVPALNKVKRYARDVRQKAQLHSIDTAIELFNSELDGYPPSGATDTTGAQYCGAMKLAEAMVGLDLMGFHPDSAFRSDGKTVGSGGVLINLYDTSTLTARKGPYLQLENANAFKISDLYWENGSTIGPFNQDLYVLCDGYNRVTNKSTTKKIGMPILYYKANTAKDEHDLINPNNPDNIYNYLDNEELVALGFPGQPGPDAGGPKHDLSDPKRFYRNTWNDQIYDSAKPTFARPYRADSYILISAGWDGNYGTADDICNFEWKFKPLP